MNLDFDAIYIDQVSKNSKVAKRFQSLFPKEKILFVDKEPFSDRNSTGQLSPEEFDRSKKNIFITEYKGQFFKRCPGTHQKMACCNYFVLNLGLQCNMNCSYCYLQSFINTPIMTIYSNLDQALNELDEMTSQFNGLSFRVGTGEVIDSLSLDPLTLYSHDLISFFKERPHLTLEFKTKSNLVDQFLDQSHAGNVIVSWSVNPELVIEKEEHLTASLKNRLEAAEKCLEKKFKISFHVDPVIWHPEWRESYSSLVDEITKRFNPEDIPYLSLGALRFQTEQRWMMKERFDLDSFVNQAEVFEGPDKKLRYDHNLRNEMFQFIIKRFKDNNPKWNIFLCMETPETWLSTFESMPKKVSGLENLFESRKSI
jgi:spore photoproduct lyase